MEEGKGELDRSQIIKCLGNHDTYHDTYLPPGRP